MRLRLLKPYFETLMSLLHILFNLFYYNQVSWSVGSMLQTTLAFALVNWLGWRIWIAASSVPLLFAATLVTVCIMQCTTGRQTSK